MSRYKPSVIRYTLAPGSHVDSWHRFSNATQDDASALAAIERYCREHELTIDQQWGRPATSGSVITSTREFTDFIKTMEERPESERRQRGVIVWKSSRLGRDQVETDYYTAHLRRLGYAVVAIADPLTGSDLDPVLESFIRWKDQRLLDDISSDVKRTMAWLRESGYSTGGRPPVGFVAVREENAQRPRKHSGDKRINARWIRGGPNEESVLLAWRMKIEGATSREIHAATHLLKDLHCYHDVWRRPCYRDAGYVTPEGWARVQADMDAAAFSRQHPRVVGSAYLLTGLLICSCGRPLTGWAEPRGHGEKKTGVFHPGPDAFSYYRCMAAKRGESCAMRRRLRTEVIDRAVLDAVSEEILAPDHLAGLRRRLAAELATAHDATDAELRLLRQRHSELKAALANLTAAVEAGSDVAALLGALRERSHDEELVRRRIHDLERAARQSAPELLSDEAWAELVRWVRDGLAGEDVRQRRRVLGALIERIDVSPEGSSLVLRYAITPRPGLQVVSPQEAHAAPGRVYTLAITLSLPKSRIH